MTRTIARFRTGIIAIFVVVFLSAPGCKTKRVTQKSPLINLSESTILEQMQISEFRYDQLSAKIAVSIESDQHNGQFKINLRMSEDSLIWMSIVPALGIEAARALVSRDSLKFIDKLKDKYYVGEFSFLDTLIQYSTEFGFLQNLLVGNPIEINADEKYVPVTDELYYVLQTKNPRKLRKALDLSKKARTPDTSMTDVVKERKYIRALDKFEGEDLVIKRYYVRALDFRVARTVIEDLELRRTVIVNHSNFEDVAGMQFPMETVLQVQTPDQSATFRLRFSRVRTEVDQSYPFKIPASYDPIR